MSKNEEFESELFQNLDMEDKEHLNQPSKYDMALGKYNTALKDEDIAAKTAHIIEKYAAENDTPEVKKFLFHCIDLTTLKCTDSETSVMKFTERVNAFDDEHPDLKNVAAICVYPNMAEIVHDTLEADDVKIACVSGGFPSSQTFTEVKVAETAMALHAGADEIDIVIPVGIRLCRKHQESLHPRHVFRSRLHQDFYRKRKARRHSRSSFRDVPGNQGILPGDRTQSRIQACRRHQHGT